ncbi:hypothetical protein ACJJTC_003378 [Scirpophaga incertulas]
MSKRKRDPTFAASEKQTLIELVERHFDIVVKIDEDFNILFPGRQDFLRQNWQPFCKKIFQLKASEIKSDDYKEDLLSSLNCLSIDEEKIPTELALLVHTVPPKGRTCKKRKFSVRECLESIMIIVENPRDIIKTVAEKKRRGS